ncbi:MAG: ATP-dependent helicase HrpB [Treponemataceae bacterium]
MTPSIRAVVNGTDLPLVPRLEEIVSALADRRLAVVRADPGSGKSTLLPLALLDADFCSEGRVLMLEPRRVAAVSVAVRMADLLSEAVGERVGYSVRLERRVGKNTRVEVVTEGLLVRRLLADPALEGVAVVIFDEFHERSIHTDLALALCLDLRRLRPELALLVMSATMDGERVSTFLAGADTEASGNTVPVPLIDCPGRPYPVSVEYRPLPGKRWLGTETADAVLRYFVESGTNLSGGSGGGTTGNFGDALVFLPGRREIDDAASSLRGALSVSGDTSVEVRILHGSMPLSEQRDLLRPRAAAADTKKRRVVFATNIAETSLTVPGVTTVIDAGMVKTQRFHISTGLDRLVLERASERACDQRTGRAGRLGPGRCIRLWDPIDARPRETEAEILRSDVASLVLDCSLWGVRKQADLFWLDPPSTSSWESSCELLRGLGALDESGSPTSRGERMSRLGVHPRLAAIALEGQKEGEGALAFAAAAILSDRDGSGIRDDADIRRRLSLLRGGDRSESSAAGFASWRSRVADLASDLSSRLGEKDSGEGFRFLWNAEAEGSVGLLLLAGFPDRVARRQEALTFRFPSGREVRVDGTLKGEEWLVIVDAEAGERTGIARLAAPIGREDAERILVQTYPEAESGEWRIEWEGLVPRAKLVRRAGRLSLGERRAPAPSDVLAASFAELLVKGGLAVLPWGEGAGSPLNFRSRSLFWAKAVGKKEFTNKLSDSSLIGDAPLWLGPFLRADGKAGASVIDSSSLLDALRALIGWEYATRIDKEAPERLETPAGTKRLLRYSEDSVALEVRIQEVFGLDRTPRVAGIPVLLRLLSPAERPLQTTDDLAGFWRNTYAEVRKEMRGRYPRHYWPEDPLVAEPTARPKPRGT